MLMQIAHIYIVASTQKFYKLFFIKINFLSSRSLMNLHFIHIPLEQCECFKNVQDMMRNLTDRQKQNIFLSHHMLAHQLLFQLSFDILNKNQFEFMSYSYYVPQQNGTINTVKAAVLANGVSLLFLYLVNYTFQILATFVLDREEKDRNKIKQRLLETSRVLYLFIIATMFRYIPRSTTAPTVLSSVGSPSSLPSCFTSFALSKSPARREVCGPICISLITSQSRYGSSYHSLWDILGQINSLLRLTKIDFSIIFVLNLLLTLQAYNSGTSYLQHGFKYHILIMSQSILS